MPFPDPYATKSRWRRRLLSFEAVVLAVFVVLSIGIWVYGWWAN